MAIKFRNYMDKRNRMRFIYAGYLKRPIDRNVILFESFHGKEISDSPLAMAKALLGMSEAGGFKLYFSTNNIARDAEALKKMGFDADISLVHIHSNDYARLLATAGILVNNSSFPSYYVRRDGQKYLQTWHGTPWKTLGRKMKGELSTINNAQHNFIQASHLLFPNDFTREVIMRDYVLDDIYVGKVISHGYPRNAVFCDAQKAKEIKGRCGDSDYTTFAYMPTWRGQDNQNIQTDIFVEETSEILRSIDESLSERQKMYVNLHPIVQSEIDLSKFKNIEPFPKDIEKYEFVNSVDALITDYSSVFFDYSITGKPIILFVYDYENYLAERGLYFDISELPFDKAYSIDELKELIESEKYKKQKYSENSEYTSRFLGYDSPNAAEEIMKYMLSDESDTNKGMKITDYSFNSEQPRRVLDCKDLPSPFDLDSVVREVKENDIVVFHNAQFGPKTGAHFKEFYDEKFPYVITTESVPETIGEAISPFGSVKKQVKERNTKRQVGNIEVKEAVENKLIRIDVKSIKAKGEKLIISMRAPSDIGKITRIWLEYRSEIEEIKHELDYSVRSKGNFIEIVTTIDTSLIKDGCIYWDFFVTAEINERSDTYHALLRRSKGAALKGRVCQCVNGDYVTFPHLTNSRALAFTHREITPYDNRKTMFVELTAFFTSIVLKKLFRKKKIWLVYEKFCASAQDNGYYFFKYCMENLSSEERKHIYYVIDKRSTDYSNVSKYGKNVVQFMSFKHILYCFAARVYIGSDSKKHLYIWRPKPNVVSGRMKNKPVHFLQHGVTALKRVDAIFGANGSSPMTHITTTSDYEQSIMKDYFGYSPTNAPVVGFTRWDVLEDKSDPNEKIILVMPTWRSWLEEKPDEDFINSDYFKNYSRMLADENLAQCLKENDVKLVFFIHPKFKDYLGRFSTSSEYIELVQFGSKPLNEIMMKCSMLVTDYSSVCWDVYYMGKPVIFYQFDYDMYMENHGSYLNMEKELFGERYTELSDVITGVRQYIENGFTESEKAKSMRSKYFKYIDSENSKRTYEYLKKRYR